MINGLPQNASEAIGQRLLTGAEVFAAVGGRITPNLPTLGEEYNTKPYIVFFKMGGGGSNDLDGLTVLQSFTYRIELHADTDEQVEALRELVLDRLCGNRRKGIPRWRDRAAGVQGCFAVDDADVDTLQDGTQIAGQTVTIHFCPQV